MTGVQTCALPIYEEKLLSRLSLLYEQLTASAEELAALTVQAEAKEDILEKAVYYQSTILPKMEEVRSYADEAETMIPDSYLSYPTYDKLLFSI